MAHSRISILRKQAVAAFEAAVARADPAAALLEHLRRNPLPDTGMGGKTFLIAVGKAAPAMANAALRQIKGQVNAICVTHRENATEVAGARVFRAGHPVPDEIGASAANAVIEMLAETSAQDVVIALISGGGSALLPAPLAGISLADKQALNAALLAGGLDISSMNLIRQQVSELKGGGLLRHAHPAKVVSYILSDVVGDDLRAIASGPTVAPLGTPAQALELLLQNGVAHSVPKSVLNLLAAKQATTVPPAAENFLIGGNTQSLSAAAEYLDPTFKVIAARSPLVGDVEDAAQTIFSAMQTASDTSVALLWGGETTVRIKGSGLGGRNQELALRVAELADMSPISRSWVFLSGGTDGRDGPTNAAGGIVDQSTLPRIRAAGVDPQALLANNDSNAALTLSDDLLVTGPTGTNVADIQIALIT